MRKWINKYTGVLRSLRITYWVYNLLHLSKLKTNRQFYKKSGIGKLPWQGISHADIKKKSPEVPWLDAPAVTEKDIREHPFFNQFNATTQQQLLQWPAKGYMIIPGLMQGEADAINAEIDTLLQQHVVEFNYTRRKIMNAWEQSEAVNSAFRKPEVLKIMEFIFNKPAIPFHTINFIYGSEQKPHSDSIHMTTEPLGYLAAIWVALEDITEGSGELIYYSGSQKLNYVMSEDYDTGNNFFKLGEHNYEHYEEKIEAIIRENHLEQKKFLAKKGDILIWHANLLHGGSAITSGKTRKSLVAHYFADGVLRYHEISQRPAIVKTK